MIVRPGVPARQFAAYRRVCRERTELNLNERREILPGVFLTTVQSTKFKTGCFSLSLLRPLRREEASANALIPTVLLRGCGGYPDIRAISAFLDDRYGASVGTLVRKKGEVQAVGFYADFLEDRFALAGEEILAPMLRFVGRLLLDPVLEQGRFVEAWVEGEKQNLINAIESRINDKRSYAVSQLLKSMCEGEAYGVPRLGDRADVEALDAAGLYRHYQHILAHSRVEIFYHGSCADAVEPLLREILRDLPRQTPDAYGTQVVARAGAPKLIREAMDVTQGKLSMGLRLGCTAADPEYPAALLMNAVYGNGVTSKLFLNVRERMSLCYYAGSSIEKFKGVMVISSGIEFSQFETAKEEILRQLDLVRQGEITEEELEAARRFLLSSLKTGMDSPARLDDYAIGQAILGQSGTMADLAEQLRAVTPEGTAAAARQVSLDTVYFLEGA